MVLYAFKGVLGHSITSIIFDHYLNYHAFITIDIFHNLCTDAACNWLEIPSKSMHSFLSALWVEWYVTLTHGCVAFHFYEVGHRFSCSVVTKCKHLQNTNNTCRHQGWENYSAHGFCCWFNDKQMSYWQISISYFRQTNRLTGHNSCWI